MSKLYQLTQNKLMKLSKLLLRLKCQRGAASLLTIILGVFTVCGLITASANIGMYVQDSNEMKRLAGMIIANADTLKRNHGDDPIAVAQADAWINMAEAIKRTNKFTTIKKLTGETMAAGVNFVPGQLPLAKGTKEAIEMGKNVYDTITGLNSAYGKEPKKPSKEMTDFFRAITQGKISPDALQIAMMKVRAQALNRQVDDLSAKLKAQEAWQEKQRKHLDNYKRLFVANSIKNAQEQLEKSGKLSSYYKKLFKEDRFKKQLGSYPQITEALKDTDELEPVTEKEKEAIDETIMEVVEESEELQKALGEAALDDLGDWEKSVLQTLAKVMEIPAQLTEEDEETDDGGETGYEGRVKKCEEERKKGEEEAAMWEKKRLGLLQCQDNCPPALTADGGVNWDAMDCMDRCDKTHDFDASKAIDTALTEFNYEMCIDEAKKSLLFGE